MSKVALDDFLTAVNVDEIGEMLNYEDFVVYEESLHADMAKIYEECLVGSEKLNSVGDVTIGEGFTSKVLFDTRKLEENKGKIVGIINEIYGDFIVGGINTIECGTVGYNDLGELEAFVGPETETLVRLGSAVGELSVLQHCYEISSLDDGDKLYAVRNVVVKEENKRPQK